MLLVLRWERACNAWLPRWLACSALWFTLMFQMAVLLGALNLSRLQITNIRRKREHWPYSVICVLVLWSYMIYGMTVRGIFAGTGNAHPTYRWIHDALIIPVDAAVFSLLAFFIASAAYRAFRVRTAEASAMMIVAVIIMLANVPVGEVIWDRFPALGGWFLRIPNAAGMRGIVVGIFLGAFAATLRLFLGLERKYLGA